jgi:hypothetical protein
MKSEKTPAASPVPKDDSKLSIQVTPKTSAKLADEKILHNLGDTLDRQAQLEAAFQKSETATQRKLVKNVSSPPASQVVKLKKSKRDKLSVAPNRSRPLSLYQPVDGDEIDQKPKTLERKSSYGNLCPSLDSPLSLTFRQSTSTYLMGNPDSQTSSPSLPVLAGTPSRSALAASTPIPIASTPISITPMVSSTPPLVSAPTSISISTSTTTSSNNNKNKHPSLTLLFVDQNKAATRPRSPAVASIESQYSNSLTSLTSPPFHPSTLSINPSNLPGPIETHRGDVIQKISPTSAIPPPLSITPLPFTSTKPGSIIRSPRFGPQLISSQLIPDIKCHPDDIPTITKPLPNPFPPTTSPQPPSYPNPNAQHNTDLSEVNFDSTINQKLNERDPISPPIPSLPSSLPRYVSLPLPNSAREHTTHRPLPPLSPVGSPLRSSSSISISRNTPDPIDKSG